MATVKGTWRFNDVLTFPTGKIEEKVRFANALAIESLGQNLTRFNILVYTDGFNDSYDIIAISINYENDSAEAMTVYATTGGGWYDDEFKTITFTSEQEVSDEFYEWFTANATRIDEEQTPIATITYKGETLETLNGGEYVTLHTKGKTMEDDIRVEVAEESGGGDIAINGIVEQYKVNAGATVNAGDFVEFVSKTGSNMLTIYDTNSVKACRLDDSRVLVVYGAQNRGNAAVLCFDNAGATIEQTGEFEPTSTITIYSVAAISSRQALVTYTGSGRLRCIVLSINSAEITAGEYYDIAGVEYRLYSCSSAVFAGGKAIIMHCSKTSSTDRPYLKATLFEVEDGKIVRLNNVTVKTSQIDDDAFYGKVVALSGNTALLTYAFVDVNTLHTYHYAYACCAIITDDVLSLGVESNLTGDRGSIFENHALVPLTGSKVVAVAPKDSFGDGRLYVLTVNENGTVSVGRITTFTAAQGDVAATALSPESALVVYKDAAGTGAAVIVNVNENNDMTLSDPAVYHTAELKNHEVLALSSASAIVLHTNTGGTGLIYTGLNVEGDTLTQEGAGTFVQPAISRLYNVGVAKTSGTEGQTVDVYCV